MTKSDKDVLAKLLSFTNDVAITPTIRTTPPGPFLDPPPETITVKAELEFSISLEDYKKHESMIAPIGDLSESGKNVPLQVKPKK